jgi:hypothetical protein
MPVIPARMSKAGGSQDQGLTHIAHSRPFGAMWGDPV